MSKDDITLIVGKEILRQGELRIKGILEFSAELDNKVFKLLGFTVTFVMGLLLYLLKNYSEIPNDFQYTCVLAEIILMTAVFMLLRAGSPMRYKGVGLPLEDFQKNISNHTDYAKILQSSGEKYKTRFEDNMRLNKKKSQWLNRAIWITCLTPAVSLFFFLGIKCARFWF